MAQNAYNPHASKPRKKFESMDFGDNVKVTYQEPIGGGFSARGECWHFECDNGLGLSIITDGYGKEDNLCEAGLLLKDGMVYNRELGFVDDVYGWLDDDMVTQLVKDTAAFELAGKKFSTSVATSDEDWDKIEPFCPREDSKDELADWDL